MIEKLIELIKAQNDELQKLLDLLKTQYNMIMNKDAFGLEGLIDKMNNTSKVIAQQEVKRRNLTAEQEIKKIVTESNNEELRDCYNNIQNTIKQINWQKETNEMLLKQEIIFNNKMLALMNPNKEIKTYNSYGNLSR